MNEETPYQIMTSILKKHKNPTKEQAKKINSFFFCRWLSNNRHTTPISCILNRYYDIPNDVQLMFANDYIELTGLRNKVSFIGVNKEKMHPDLQKLLNNIKRYYKINDQQAEEYFKLMDNNERNRLFNMYNEGIQK